MTSPGKSEVQKVALHELVIANFAEVKPNHKYRRDVAFLKIRCQSNCFSVSPFTIIQRVGKMGTMVIYFGTQVYKFPTRLKSNNDLKNPSSFKMTIITESQQLHTVLITSVLTRPSV